MPTPVLPTLAFDKTKAAFIRKSYVVFTENGTSTVTTLIGKLSNVKGDLTVLPLKEPDAIGVLRTVRNAPNEATEEITLSDMEDVGSVLSFLGSLTAMKTGTAQCFWVDPSDLAGKVRFLSDVFPCSVMRDGDIKFGDGNWAKNPSLKFVSEKLGAISITPDATVT